MMELFGMLLIRAAEISVLCASVLCGLIVYVGFKNKSITIMGVGMPALLSIAGIIMVIAIELAFQAGKFQ